MSGELSQSDYLKWALDRIEAISGPVTEPWASFDEARRLVADGAESEGRSEVRLALAELVRLKDGPRDDAYHAAKDAAWDKARAVLASSYLGVLGERNETGPRKQQEQQYEPVRYGDLTAGETVEVYVCVENDDWDWEPRQVVAVEMDKVVFRDGAREYPVDRSRPANQMRRKIVRSDPRWVRAMGEPRRWTKCTLLGRGDSFDVREDRATDTDIQAIALRLAERDHGGPLTGPVCTGYVDEATSLLTLVFSEEASRV
jgi:hypothetical protein